MQHETKSILDGMEVKEHGFSLGKTCGASCKTEKLTVVGHCPTCGSPIYGPRSVTADETVVAKHSCACQQSFNKTFAATVHTK